MLKNKYVLVIMVIKLPNVAFIMRINRGLNANTDDLNAYNLWHFNIYMHVMLSWVEHKTIFFHLKAGLFMHYRNEISIL